MSPPYGTFVIVPHRYVNTRWLPTPPNLSALVSRVTTSPIPPAGRNKSVAGMGSPSIV
jgi:hypothetical protein